MIRHGQSVANEQKRFAGHSDFDLTDLGKEQARSAGEYIYKNYKVDAIYASDLRRAYKTAIPAAELFGLPITKKKGLRELFVGEWETLEYTQVAREYPEDYDVWLNNYPFARCTEGESVNELYHRVVDCVLGLAKENDGKTILIATHATPVRAFGCKAMGLPPEKMSEAPTPVNAAICVFEVENDTASVVKYNITEHLTKDQVTELGFKY